MSRAVRTTRQLFTERTYSGSASISKASGQPCRDEGERSLPIPPGRLAPHEGVPRFGRMLEFVGTPGRHHQFIELFRQRLEIGLGILGVGPHHPALAGQAFVDHG